MCYNVVKEGERKAPQKKEENIMTRVHFYGITESGCGCYASVAVPEESTMNQIVQAIKAAGYTAFRLESMKVIVEI
jgi:hypothetical protein